MRSWRYTGQRDREARWLINPIAGNMHHEVSIGDGMLSLELSHAGFAIAASLDPG